MINVKKKTWKCVLKDKYIKRGNGLQRHTWRERSAEEIYVGGEREQKELREGNRENKFLNG